MLHSGGSDNQPGSLPTSSVHHSAGGFVPSLHPGLVATPAPGIATMQQPVSTPPPSQAGGGRKTRSGTSSGKSLDGDEGLYHRSNKVELFDGDRGIALHEWLSNFEALHHNYGWSDHVCASTAHERTRGQAQKALHRLKGTGFEWH